MLAASTRLGPYRIVAPIGAGGMGEVYRARDTRLGRDVAVKVLPEQFARDPDRRARFEREARAVAALSHPSILAIHDYGTHEGLTYAVMELLEGETLHRRLGRGPLSSREAIEIGAAVAEGLAAAHSRSIIHRDLKPENIFLTAEGRVKILDFGLARISPVLDSRCDTASHVPALTETGMVMGTVGYMSPEQVRGEPADARSDIFSFGCVLYEMVTGRRAFQRETAAETMAAILHDEPSDPAIPGKEIPAGLGLTIRQCLAKSPSARLQSARDLALGLRASSTHPVSPERPPARRSARWVAGIVLAALASGAGWSAYLLWNAGHPGRSAGGATEAMAVLPFENLAGDPGMEPLSDGLADHIIRGLSRVRRRHFKVRPFTSVSRYKQGKTDVRTMGSELNVRWIVTGALRREGDGLSVSVELVDAREEDHLWGKRYEGAVGGILDLQDRIARDVAGSVGLVLTGEDEERLTRRSTQDPEAYLFYREGVHHFNRFTEEAVETSIECFRRAIEKDPGYALAHAAMARSYVLLGTTHRGLRVTCPEARRSVARALEIDESLPEAHSALAVIHVFHDWDWLAAERELKLVTAADDASLVPSWNIYSFYLAAHGRLEEALAAARRGQEIDPLAAPRRNEVAMCHNWMRQYDQAIAEARRANELDPGFFLAYRELGIAYIQKGMHAEAIEVLERGLKIVDHPRLKGLLGYSHAVAGRHSDARRVLDELKAHPRYGTAHAAARIHAALGERDQAFEWLGKSCDERDSLVIWLKVDATMDNLRSDPRFAGVLESMGLPP